jgi:serine O-acetyltransferase
MTTQEPGLVDRSAASTGGLWELLVEDFRRHDCSWVDPGLHALWVHRVGHWGLSRPRPVRLAVKVLHRLVNRLLIQNLYGTEIADEAFIGRRVAIGHHQGVQIPAFAVLGDETIIRSNVTLGFTGTTSAREDVPRLGRRVEVGVGACLLGRITVGDDAKIGPHAIVTVDVPAGATAFSPPARILRPRLEAGSGAGT